MNKKSASATIYIIFFFVMFLAFSAFAVDGAIVLTNRVKLQNATEAAVLTAASNFNSLNNVSDSATNTFNMLKADCLESATSIVQVNSTKKQVLMTTEYLSRPIFLAFLGVTGIKLEAKACALSESRSVMYQYTGVNWLTSAAQYISDVLPPDSSIVKPLSGYKSASYDSSSIAKLNLIESGGLSLGPGGYVTIKLPVPLVDKPGNDLYIEENGSASEGYMIFAGLDVNPDNPYVNSTKKGDDIYWVNISCSGKSINIGAPIEDSTTDGLGSQKKFYGSGNFDIGANCTKANLSMAKYLRIVDDNEETAYFGATKYVIPGEASTATPGADISSVKVLNSVKLMSPADYGV